LALGCTVRELLARTDSQELAEWMAFYQLEPFGDERADYRQALTTCVIANANRDKSKKPTPFTPEDFMIGKKTPPKEQTWEEMRDRMQVYCDRQERQN
jgi:hypothetical protein